MRSLTAVQLLSYIVRIWEQRLRERLKLCPILPLVIYHGQDKWTAARRIDELMDIPEFRRGELPGKIQVMQELLGVSPSAELDAMSIADLEALLSQLQTRLRNRDA